MSMAFSFPILGRFLGFPLEAWLSVQKYLRKRGFSTPLISVKVSATLENVAAPPPGARPGFGGPNCPQNPTEGGSGMGCDSPVWYMREIGIMWQIGVLTGKTVHFSWPKMGHLRRFGTTKTMRGIEGIERKLAYSNYGLDAPEKSFLLEFIT